MVSHERKNIHQFLLNHPAEQTMQSTGLTELRQDLHVIQTELQEQKQKANITKIAILVGIIAGAITISRFFSKK